MTVYTKRAAQLNVCAIAKQCRQMTAKCKGTLYLSLNSTVKDQCPQNQKGKVIPKKCSSKYI